MLVSDYIKLGSDDEVFEVDDRVPEDDEAHDDLLLDEVALEVDDEGVREEVEQVINSLCIN